jgi:hypothetical protein
MNTFWYVAALFLGMTLLMGPVGLERHMEGDCPMHILALLSWIAVIFRCTPRLLAMLP